jgi:hypothetical protein
MMRAQGEEIITQLLAGPKASTFFAALQCIFCERNGAAEPRSSIRRLLALVTLVTLVTQLSVKNAKLVCAEGSLFDARIGGRFTKLLPLTMEALKEHGRAFPADAQTRDSSSSDTRAASRSSSRTISSPSSSHSSAPRSLSYTSAKTNGSTI